MTQGALFAVAEDVVAAAIFGGLVTFIPVFVKWTVVFLKARGNQTRQARVDTIEEWRQYANTVIADREVIKGERDAERAGREADRQECERQRRQVAEEREHERKDAQTALRESEQRAARLSAIVARTIAWIRALESTLRQMKVPVEPFNPDPDADASGSHAAIPKDPTGGS